MITFIEQDDVERAMTDTITEVDKEIARYREGAKKNTDVGNMIANGMWGTRNIFLLRLYSAYLISEDCYNRLRNP